MHSEVVGMLSFGVLGPLVVHDEYGRGVPVRGVTQRRALAALLSRANETVAHDTLIAALWEEQTPARPQAALQTTMSRLRSLLKGSSGAVECIRTEATGYRLVVDDPERLDCWKAEELLKSARAALDRPEVALPLLVEADRLWRGVPFGEVAEHVQFQPVVAHWEEVRLAIVESRAEALLNAGRAGDAALLLEPHIQAHPGREHALGQFMRALYASGRQIEALSLYDRHRRELSEELGLDPSPDLQRIEQQILRHELPTVSQEERPPAASAPSRNDSAASRIPVPASQFIGRDDDIASISRLLEHRRLVTLLGIGGIGKTRLALHCARAVVDRYPDGITVCRLAELPPGADIVHAVAASLGVVPDASRSVEDHIAAALTGKRHLLLLDNCEHVVAAASELMDRLLASTESLDVLATSREALHIGGEQVWQVSPLAVPLAGEDTAPAVDLFLDRALAADPRLRFTAEEMRQVVRVCRQLDGIPLAIEIVAARLGVLTIDEVSARLADRLTLTNRTRSTGTRHRSLADVIDWSYDLLTPDEKRLFDQLSVFPGEFTLEAAAAITRTDDGPVPDIADLLLRLVDRSLVQRAERHGTSRYRLLDALRQYGHRNLTRTGTAIETGARHAGWYANFADTVTKRPLIAGLSWIETIDAELPNLRAARQWATEHDPALAVRLVASLHWYAAWCCSREAFEWAEAAVKTAGEVAPELLPTVLATIAVGAWMAGDMTQARCLTDRGMAAAEKSGAEPPRYLLDVAGDIASFDGKFSEAAQWYDRALDRARSERDDVQRMINLGCIALATAQAEDDADPVILADEVLKEVNRGGSPDLRAWAYYCSAHLVTAADRERARRDLWTAVDLAGRTASPFVLGLASLALAIMEIEDGDDPSSEAAEGIEAAKGLSPLNVASRFGNQSGFELVLENTRVQLTANDEEWEDDQPTPPNRVVVDRAMSVLRSV
ncbi:BTAD domain-containing putative transcriptional regulator [Streptomyces sp. NPDC087908]|uniref:BTAD domain-containing putative transcriptional regulator n=1 Tax=Streptomyces sp. NPDC087908 TaxID=3365820 RepID=UPI003802AFCD